MPLHPQARDFLDMVASWGRPPRHTLSPQENREGARLLAPYTGDVTPLPLVEDRELPGPAGNLPVRVYRPLDSGDPLPAFVYFHGGGWVIGDLDGYDTICRDLAKLAGCVVVAVGYRLAPEHPFPAALDDCLAAVRDIADRPSAYGADATRIAVGGDSAGGNLAAVVAGQLGDSEPRLVHQLLVYPVVDTDPDRWASYADFAEGYYLSRADMAWYLGHYVPDADRADPRVAPLRAADLSGLPPATVITAEYDVLRDEGEAYAGRLRDAGVPVAQRRFEGMFHPFFHLAGALDAGREAREWAASRLRVAFGSG